MTRRRERNHRHKTSRHRINVFCRCYVIYFLINSSKLIACMRIRCIKLALQTAQGCCKPLFRRTTRISSVVTRAYTRTVAIIINGKQHMRREHIGASSTASLCSISIMRPSTWGSCAICTSALIIGNYLYIPMVKNVIVFAFSVMIIKPQLWINSWYRKINIGLGLYIARKRSIGISARERTMCARIKHNTRI